MAVSVLPLLRGDKVNTEEVDFRDALPVNMSGVLRQVYGANGYMLQQPGLSQYATGQGVDRGGVYNTRFQTHYRVSGNRLIEVSPDGVVTNLGTVLGSKTCALPFSFNNQCIVTAGRMYLYNDADGLRRINDTDLGMPIDATWIDGYFFLTDGQYIYHTEIGNEESIDPLQFATAEFAPDPTIGLGKTTDNKVIVFNFYSIEYFENVASDNFAFTRIPSRAQKRGLVATHAKCEIGGQWYFVGGAQEESVSVWAMGVGNSTEIASREVVKLINQYTRSQLSETILESRVVDDYSYLILHLPNEVLLFNQNMAEAVGKDYAWSLLRTGVAHHSPWRGVHGVFEPRKGVWVYGDKWGSNIGVLNDELATHYGELAEWELHSPLIYLEDQSIDEIEIFTIPGFDDESVPAGYLTITEQPQNGIVPVTLSVSAIGSGELTYQWQLFSGGEWEDIEGATESTYSVTEGNEGEYRVVVSIAGVGSVISSSALASQRYNVFIDEVGDSGGASPTRYGFSRSSYGVCNDASVDEFNASRGTPPTTFTLSIDGVPNRGILQLVVEGSTAITVDGFGDLDILGWDGDTIFYTEDQSLYDFLEGKDGQSVNATVNWFPAPTYVEPSDGPSEYTFLVENFGDSGGSNPFEYGFVRDDYGICENEFVEEFSANRASNVLTVNVSNIGATAVQSVTVQGYGEIDLGAALGSNQYQLPDTDFYDWMDAAQVGFLNVTVTYG